MQLCHVNNTACTITYGEERTTVGDNDTAFTGPPAYLYSNTRQGAKPSLLTRLH